MGRATALQHPDVAQALREYVLAVADDELILGHRHSEWTGLGPDIESDVALSSIAQEEMGHARLFYQQLLALSGQYQDHQAPAVWPEALGLFEPTPGEADLLGAGLLAESSARQQQRWRERVVELCGGLGVPLPRGAAAVG